MKKTLLENARVRRVHRKDEKIKESLPVAGTTNGIATPSRGPRDENGRKKTQYGMQKQTRSIRSAAAHPLEGCACYDKRQRISDT
jgi:hypothetical protein